MVCGMTDTPQPPPPAVQRVIVPAHIELELEVGQMDIDTAAGDRGATVVHVPIRAKRAHVRLDDGTVLMSIELDDTGLNDTVRFRTG